ncbi:MAG: phytanoyl-CoA dioxygenase family protein [Methylotenera sp.]|nr:phytanoyl-CoA dioxygenase family protein [Flavobacterium sp.]
MASLTDFKPLFSLYNLLQYKKLKHNLTLFKKWGIKKYYFSSISSDDFKNNKNITTPWLDLGDSKKLLESNPELQVIPDRFKVSLKNWSENGFSILENFFSGNEVDTINSEVAKLLAQGEIKWKHKNKLMFATEKSNILHNTVIQPLLINILSMLMGKKVFLFQSINFYKGSEQSAHSDIVHMTTFPQGYLIAVWIALEDVSLDQGPLFYYPGSHKLPYFMNSDYDHGGNKYFLGKRVYKNYENAISSLISDKNFERKTFEAKKGDLLIWHANLLHGGSPILRPDSTRKSMVLHFYAENVICYHEISQRPALLKPGN